MKQEMMGDRGISWTIYKSFALCCRQITQSHQHLITQFLQAGCTSCHQTNSVKALKDIQEKR